MKHRLYRLSLLLLIALIFPCALAEGGFSSNPDAIEQAAQSVLMLEVFDSEDNLISTGSGFVAFDNRTMVTNYHVIEGADWMLANSDAGFQYMVTKVLVADEDKDIAICRFMSPTDLKPLELNISGQLKRAESIVAIGSPIGITNTVSLGNISALYEDADVAWIQFTAPISSGSSGGALFDDSGAVIGVTSASYIDTQNLNLAVHVSEVEKLYRNWDGQESPFDEYLAMISATPSPAPTPTPSPTPMPTATPVPYATPVPIPVTKDYEPVWEGDRGDKVRKMQQVLIDLGYLDGRADGVYGKMTGEAVKLFCEVNGIGTGNAWGNTLSLLYEGNPYRYDDTWMALCFADGAQAEWERIEGNKLKIHFPVTSRARRNVISGFELYVYATDNCGELVYGNTRYYETTAKVIHPGETVNSVDFVLPECDRIYRIWCGISKVMLQYSPSYEVPNYWDYKVEYWSCDGTGEIKPW